MASSQTSPSASPSTAPCIANCCKVKRVVSERDFTAIWRTVGTTIAAGCRTESGGIDVAAAAAMIADLPRQLEECAVGTNTDGTKPYGVPTKSGVEVYPADVWDAVHSFIESGIWLHSNPALPSDSEDPLLQDILPFGQFMLGFDFHLTPSGPKLIEVNTNAGGLATALSLGGCSSLETLLMTEKWVDAILSEYRTGVEGEDLPVALAVIDEKPAEQGLYAEMLLFARLVETRVRETRPQFSSFVCDPSELSFDVETNRLIHTASGTKVDLVYNRLTDFRFEEASNQHLRAASLQKAAVITPHPATYVRVADKRLLALIDHPVVPKTVLMETETPEFWEKNKKRFVFKPSDGNGSRGVYRGDKVSNSKLRELPRGETLAQEYCPPSVATDGSKYDLRVYTSGKTILGVASRQFNGQVMEMRLPNSGFRAALPENVCCFSALPGVVGC